eukprot:CAMPEP_0118662618 /NCGR_PEP_ID=MMETSP0785-20121206/16929_1 /TAXON_ID=91992 /ORGANISM="Bolidomonas pacifica, Strain CCMP 1866" /LENGTH=418 /DNA_ID=CAMNT_0006556177 /DNA_START=46 /DNA_END=1299 /DNA_ORIENTATION=+
MGAKEVASRNKVLSFYVGYMLLFIVTSIITFTTYKDRVKAAPIAGECTANPADCPTRSFCYREFDVDNYNNKTALFNLMDSNGDFLYDEADIEADGGVLRYVCGCYALYGEGGVQPLPGGEEGDYCKEDLSYKGIILVLNYITLIITGFSVFHTHRTIFQLVKVEALQFNASGITMVFTALAALCQFVLVIIYLAELQGVTDPVYKLNDSVRPACFGYFAVSLMSAMLEVSLMWADVYMKSKKMGSDDNTIAKLKKAVYIVISMTFIMVLVPLLMGLTPIAGAWAAFILISISIIYYRKGKQLSSLLMPADATAPGASSAKAAADQILITAKAIPINNGVFILFLGGHFVTVQRPASKAISMICVFGFLIMGVAQQFRLLYYVRFGARKKLHKAGYKGFRSSMMSTLTSSVAPEDNDS